MQGPITVQFTEREGKIRMLGQLEQQQANLQDQWNRLEAQRQGIIQELAPAVSPDAPPEAKDALERDPLREMAKQDAAILDVPTEA